MFLDNAGNFHKGWNEWWFLTDPEAFVYRHLPVSSDNHILQDVQMINKPFTSSKYWDTIVDRDPATRMFGMEPLTMQNTRFETNAKEIVIQYSCSRKLTHFISLYEELSGDSRHSDKHYVLMPDFRWHMIYEKDGVVTARIRFPQRGHYSVRLSAQYNIEGKTEAVTCFQYRVFYDGRRSVGFPKGLDQAWGEQPEFLAAGFKVIKPLQPYIKTKDGYVVIKLKLPSSGILPNKHRLINSTYDSERLKCVYAEKRGNLITYYIQCPETGEYKFEIYAKYDNQDPNGGYFVGAAFFIQSSALRPVCYPHPSPRDFNTHFAGPNEHFYKMGLSTDTKSSTLTLTDRKAKLHIKKYKPTSILVEIFTKADKINKDRYLKVVQNDNECIVTISEPQLAGFYWIELYAAPHDTDTYPYAGSFCLPYKCTKIFPTK